MSLSLVEVKDIYKKYKEFELSDVSFNLEEGKIYGFVGENGSGKSTTMKAMVNLINIDKGEIDINGKINYKLTSLEKENISFTLDDICLPDQLKIKALNKIFKYTFNNWDEKVFFDYLKKFNVDQNKKIKELSKGMKAKFNLAISLSHKANILILDEPMNGLDPVARDEMCDLLQEFVLGGDNRTVLISSHIISDLEKICTDFIFIHQGKILLRQDKKSLENAFIKVELNEEDFNKLDKFKVVRYKKNLSSIDVLLKNDESNKDIHGEKATAEDILIFLIRGKTIWKST